MFSKAFEKAFKYTKPLIISTRTVDGTVKSEVGTYFFINREGYAITAGHFFDSFMKYQADQKSLKGLGNKSGDGKTIEMTKGNTTDEYVIQEPHAKGDPKWITNHSFWFGVDGARLANVFVNRQLDIAVMKLDNVKEEFIGTVPVFGDMDALKPGTTLCRMGFPLFTANTEFDLGKRAFRITNLPLPMFTDDTVHSRNIIKGKSKDGYDLMYLETATPGLNGQDGGPLFDSEGRVYGMHVANETYVGAYSTHTRKGNEVSVQSHDKDVGMAVHGKVILKLLRDRKVDFSTEEETSNGEKYIIN
ncbi:MAG: serine protease [archaeon]|nr:serine protease [archaeon]